MSENDWQVGFAKSLGVFLNGRAIPTTNERGEPILDESFYLMFNAHHEPLDFTLPEEKWGTRWAVLLNTVEPGDYMSEEAASAELAASAKLTVQPWSLILLRRTGWE
jgi:glycogen operon protein